MPLRPCPVPAAATWPCGSCPWQGSLPPHASVWPGCRWAGEEVTGTSPSGSPGASAPSWNPGPICGDGSLHGAGTSQAGCPEGGPAWVSSHPTAQTLRAAPLELRPGTRCAPSRDSILWQQALPCPRAARVRRRSLPLPSPPTPSRLPRPFLRACIPERVCKPAQGPAVRQERTAGRHLRPR